MVNKPQLIMLRGLPASGKSTWAKEQIAKGDGKIKRVNKDDLRAMVDGGKWSKQREKHILSLRNSHIIDALFDGYSVIVDDTNFSPSHESKLRHMAEELEVEFVIKEFYVPPTVAEERDALRPNGVGAKVIRRMWRESVCKPAPAATTGRPAVVCDLDGTLCDISHRSPYDASKCGDDVIAHKVANLLDYYTGRGLQLFFCSGREAKYRPETEEWLKRHGFNDYILMMRDTNDTRPDWIVKREIYETELKGRYDIEIVLDDRQQVVDMWREEGLTVLQVADGVF